MPLSVINIVSLVKELDTNLLYSFVNKNNKNKICYIGTESDLGPLKFERVTNLERQAVTVSITNLQKIASYIIENVPFSIDAIVNGSGNWRSLFESVLANTSEFYPCRIGGQKFLVWIPSKKHEIGKITELPKDIKLEKTEVHYSMEERFRFYLQSKGCQQGAVNTYCNHLNNTIPLVLKKVFALDINTVFEISDFAELEQYRQNLWENPDFLKTKDTTHNANTAAFNNYSQMLKMIESENSDENDRKIDFSYSHISTENLQDYRQYITAIKAKPFVLLAGISGTGKSRIVRQLAYATGGEDSRKVQKPFNYEMIPVRPNWHDSADLLGYVSRVSGKPEYIVTDFLRFLAKAWFYEKVPFFLCLDEMNLAPVEQYFAEFLSVTESRKLRDKQIMSDALIPPLSSFDKNVADAEKVSDQILKDLFHGLWVKDGWENNDVANRIEQLKKQFRNEGISIPNNFIVMGTVNMDETTYSFSRKVLDRAMTIEMNIVRLEAGLDLSKDTLPSVSPEMILPMAVEGYDVYLGNEAICDQVIAYLKVVNRQLEGTPFKIGYRTRNEFLLYVLANLQFQSDSLGEKEVIDRALDEMTFMKILSRIEGDKNKVGNVLTDLETVIKESFPSLAENLQSVSLVKLGEMKGKLEKSFYCTFWS